MKKRLVFVLLICFALFSFAQDAPDTEAPAKAETDAPEAAAPNAPETDAAPEEAAAETASGAAETADTRPAAPPSRSAPLEPVLAPAEVPSKPRAPPQTAPRWAGAIPEELRRPRREDAPLYPRDAVIGELGQGEADNDSYRYARNVLYDLAMQKKTSAFLSGLSRETAAGMFEKLALVAPRKYRIGGGMVEPDGSVSFLYRFLGRESEVSGSIYFITGEGGAARLDDVLMEDVIETGSIRDVWDYNYLPYERFY